MRLIDEAGKQAGVVQLEEALRMAKERNLDLIQVTEKVEPPVCKMMEYGKYLYSLEKKERRSRVQKGGGIKGIRITFNISPHDLETRAKQAEKFLKEGDRIRLEMILRGREKQFGELAREKVNQFLEILTKFIPTKVEGEIRREPRGFSIIIAKS